MIYILNKLILIIGVLVISLFLFAYWLIFVKPVSAVNNNQSYTLCHHTPANEVTLNFNNQQAYDNHQGVPHSNGTYDTVGACPSSYPSPSVSPSTSPSPRPSTSSSPQPSPSEEQKLAENSTASQSSSGGSECSDASPTISLSSNNFHILRNGNLVQFKWEPDHSQGDKVQLFWGVNGYGQQSSLITENDGFVEIDVFDTQDYTFWGQYLRGCAAGPLSNAVVDGNTNDWVLFR